MVDAALSAFGRIDAAFANAGFGGPRGFLKDTPEHWREMVLTNVYGAALTLRATIPALKRLARASAAHLERRRAARPARLDVLVHQARGHGDGRGRPPGPATAAACA